jgi:hypothetical protein
MEIVYPTLTATRAAPLDRIDYLRNFCKLKIFMAEFLTAKPSGFVPNIIFGPADGGYHSPLFREGASNTHSLADLESLAALPNVIIGFKERGVSNVVRFEVAPKAFANLLSAFEDRIKDIANLSSVWTPIFHLGHPCK